jgi:HEAT repeat protein
LEGSPNRLDNIRTLRVSHLDVAFASAFGTLVGGSFLVGYIKTIARGGEADLWIGLLSSVPSFLGLIQIPGAIWGRSFPGYKRFIAPGGLLWRLLHLPLAVLPLLALGGSAKLAILLGCVGLAAAIINIVNPVYNDWLAEMVPSTSRGTFFATRNSISTAVGASIGILGGITVDYFKRSGLQAEGYSVVFGAALICSAISMFFFFRMRDIPRLNPVKGSISQSLNAFKLPFRDREFRKVLGFLFVTVAGQTFAGNLWGSFAFESLKFSQTNLQMCALTHATGNVLASRFWGFLADKYGNKPLLTLVGGAMLLTPVPWLLCRPGEDTHNLVVLVISHVFMGATWSGIMVCQFNILLATSKPEERATYIGTGLAIQALAGGIAPLMGSFLLTIFRGQTSTLGAYQWIFLTTIGIRCVALMFLAPIKESGSAGFKATLKVLRGVTPTGIKAMRNLSRSGDALERETAINKIAGEGLSLASDELIVALHDPSPRVRRQAAAALGRLGDERAVGELVHQLLAHPDLVEEETVEALGDLGSSDAIAPLILLLESPRPLLRRAACKAISQIPGAGLLIDAVASLQKAAESPHDPDLRRAALQALRNLEATGIGTTISTALVDVHPSVRIAAAEAAAELELEETADACRESLALYADEACSEVAYALGVVGNLDDLPRILAVAQVCESMTTRRRCLLGAARIFGVEREAYKLLMLDGMARDKELIAMLSTGGKQSKSATNALTALANGDESLALDALHVGPDAAPLHEIPVKEGFVVAVCVYSSRMSKRSGK